MKLLIAEDEQDLNDVISNFLKKNDYIVDSAYDGKEALDYLEWTNYDLIILDIMMPEIDGFEVLEKLRLKDNPTPVLFLTARDQIEDRVKGLNLGADDYLIKPFNFDELLARINAIIRRHYKVSSNLLKIKDLVLDRDKKTISIKGNPVDLTGKEYDILEYLLLNKNHIKSKDQIRDNLWEFDSNIESNVIEVLVKNLRKKIDQGRDKSLITTKRNLGYVIQDD